MNEENGQERRRIFVPMVNAILGKVGLSLNKKIRIDQLCQTADEHRALVELAADGSESSVEETAEKIRLLKRRVAEFDASSLRHSTAEDFDAKEKREEIVENIDVFGACDFAELSWLFASSLINHKFIHQRFDEAALLWRTVKMCGGPILEIGRAAGGSTVCILGASGDRTIVSIERDPQHPEIVKEIFAREDVKDRLKLYHQTSREPIPEDSFGMLFIDGDHSYEGICQDIARYWNTLEPCDGKPALAAFHDAAQNPITFVAPVKRALDELLAEEGVARVVETAGATLVVEKLSDIDEDTWYSKEDSAFWQGLIPEDKSILPEFEARPSIRIGQKVDVDPRNLLGRPGQFPDEWTCIGVEMARLPFTADSPVRHLVEIEKGKEDKSPERGHRLQTFAKIDTNHFVFRAFVRPAGVSSINLSVNKAGSPDGVVVRFDLTPEPGISVEHEEPWSVEGAALELANGYYMCEIVVKSEEILSSVRFVIECISPNGATQYDGTPGRGIIFNLSSVHAVKGKAYLDGGEGTFDPEGVESAEAARQHIRNAIESAPLKSFGSPYIVADDVLPRQTLEAVNRFWPDIKGFEHDVPGNRVFILRKEADYSRLMDEEAKFWKYFNTEVFPGILGAIAGRFQPVLEEIFGPDVCSQFHMDMPLSLMEADSDYAGHGMHTHFYHNPNWLFTVLFYVDLNDTESVGTTLNYVTRGSNGVVSNNLTNYRASETGVVEDNWRIDAAFEPLKVANADRGYEIRTREIPFVANRLFSFVDGPLSFHSVRKPESGEAEKQRRSQFGGMCSRRRILRAHIGMKSDAFRKNVSNSLDEDVDLKRVLEVLKPEARLSDQEADFRETEVRKFVGERISTYARATEKVFSGSDPEVSTAGDVPVSDSKLRSSYAECVQEFQKLAV